MKIGNELRDIVTGFTGIAIAKVEYLNGCVQFCLKGKSKDGSMPEGQYIDIHQLEYVGEGVNVVSKETGGIMSDTPNKRNGAM